MWRSTDTDLIAFSRFEASFFSLHAKRCLYISSPSELFPVVASFCVPRYSILASVRLGGSSTAKFGGPVDWEDDHGADRLLKLWEVLL